MTLELSPLPEPPCMATLSGVLKVFGNARQVALGSRTQQPHQQKEGHHRRHEVGIGDLPRTAVVTPSYLLDAFDDDGRFLFAHLGPSAIGKLNPGEENQRDFAPLTCSSSSLKVGRSVENRTLRPNSTAIAGAYPLMLANSVTLTH